jgi:protein TonB
VNRKRRPARWVPVAIAGGGMLVAILLVVWWARTMMSQKAKKPRDVPQVVQLIRPPPQDTPPPPPPPPPDKVEEPLPQDQAPPDQTPDSPSQQLGLDADASAGSDAFGLAARKGGADLVGTGTAIFGRYTALLKDTILGRLSDDDRVRKGSYAVVVRVWVSADGSVQRVALVQGSGKRELDSLIEQALTRSMRVAEAPPLEMPQPVTLRIVSRG